MAIKQVGVLGCGLMGSGIAQVAAAAGYATVVKEVADEFLKKGIAAIEKSTAKLVDKGALTAEKRNDTLGRLKGTTKFEDLADCDIVIEAITENLQVKRETYATIDKIVKPAAIFASNTSSLVITEMMTATRRVDRFIGMHFFNPVPLMKLVEVIRAESTSDATAAAVVALARDLGKEPVEARDVAGFVSNRILMPFINEAVYALSDGVAEPHAIDTVAKLGFGHPIGPLALADLIGLDTCVAIMEVLRNGLDDEKYAPCPLLVEHVEAGRLGRKSGRGFYTYE
jgi:3-hydroxybutyryl-CoA dehydrogenase